MIPKQKMTARQSGKHASAGQYSIAGIDRAVTILSALAEHGSLQLAEVARETGLSSPTALRYLSSLTMHGFVERDAAKQYRLGVELFHLGQKFAATLDVRRIALPFMEDLLERYQETVNLVMRYGDDLRIIEVLESSRSIKKGATVGDRDFWHSSALGKAILAHLDESEAKSLLEKHGMATYTRRTITTVDRMLLELEHIRGVGYAIDDEESEDGLCCIAAAIMDKDAEPRYAISISGPVNRFSYHLRAEAGHVLAETTAAVGESLGYKRDFRSQKKPTVA